MATVASIWRHPIKSHGREAMQSVSLATGQTMPWDRTWAVTHDGTKHDGDGWSNCRNFMIGTRTPALAGLWATLDEEKRCITLRHAALGEITFQPDLADHVDRFVNWVAPLAEDSSVSPSTIVSAGARGMTDTPTPTISVMSSASHAAVAARLGDDLEMERWRGNIWLDGLSPWEEFEWIGKRIRIGTATLDVDEPIQRCKHTTANPHTGKRDTDTLGALKEHFGHQNFGVYAVVVDGGSVSIGDTAEVL